MSISPEVQFTNVLEENTEEEAELQTLKTYRIDFISSTISSEIIDYEEAIKQFVYMALRTQRFLHPIYSQDYGSQIVEVIRDKEITEELRLSEIERMVKEALIYDERIEDVTNYESRKDGDRYIASFDVVTVDEVMRMEEVYLDG